MKKLLLVDDEQNVLHALQRELREHYETEAYTSPAAALTRSRTTRFDLVISDYKMAEMNGIEFLKQFGELQEDAARLLLSGEADMETLMRTVNETHIYRFIPKPWDSIELLSGIRQALAYREAVLSSRLHEESARACNAAEASILVYRIVLVESDAHLLALMARGLSDESAHNNLYDAIQYESKLKDCGKTRCVVNAFSSALDALNHIEKNPCDLVITAQSLSDMEGIALLGKVRQIAPDTARILISQEPDKNLLAQAINEAEIHRLLPLNWNSHEPRTDARRQAWNLYQLRTAALQDLASRKLRLQRAHQQAREPI